MGNENVKFLKQSVASIPRDNDKEIEIDGGAGEMGKNIFKVSHWKTQCRSYFKRYFKSSPVIVGPSDKDKIMNTLCSVCSGSKSRGFVFKNYDITKHMDFLGYNKGLLVANLGAAPTSQSISYIAYIEQKNVMFICEEVSNGANICQSSKNIAVMVKRFLTLYNMEIQASGVKVIGLSIRGEEKQEELVECSFCQLFSLSYEDFESATAFNARWNVIEVYEDWWNLADTGLLDFVNPEKQHQLFEEMAAEILCFMAVQEKSLPTLTDNKSEQFKQTYFIYTRQQMEIHFSNAKHLIIQGAYGSGKSLLGLKKLELISKNLGQHEKIIYINFDPKSNLHFVMEKNVKRYAGIPQRKIKHTNGILEILQVPGPLIYVCHNSAGEDLSTMLQETVRLNATSKIDKTNYHLIVEEYDGETLSYAEAAKITEVVQGSDLLESNIILLAQPLMKTRSWNLGKASFENETCVFNELENIFKLVRLEEVLRCSNKICRITKSSQTFVQNKDSVFKTSMNNVTLDQQHLSKDNKKLIVSPSVPESSYTDLDTPSKVKTSRNEVSNPTVDISTSDRRLDRRMDLDQAFERSAPLQKSKGAKSKIVSKFGFLSEPKEGVDIKGLEPNIVEFSKDINLGSDIAVISLALVLKKLIGKNEATTLLHMAEEQPRILKRTTQLLPRLIDEKFSYTQDIEEYLQKTKQSKMIFSSNFRSVNGMEFDHVIIVVSHSEYYLKYYLPQAMSRCTFDLTLVMLPKDKMKSKKGVVQNLKQKLKKHRSEKNKETVSNMIEELKHQCRVKQVAVSECRLCENNRDCYSISSVTDNKETFHVHTHSGQYKELLSHLAEYPEYEDQARGLYDSSLADAK